jgi:hypothetical protein
LYFLEFSSRWENCQQGSRVQMMRSIESQSINASSCLLGARDYERGVGMAIANAISTSRMHSSPASKPAKKKEAAGACMAAVAPC